YIMGDQPNPLTITGGSGSEKIQATMTGGKLVHVQGSSWEAFPTTQGEQTINVTIDGKTTSKKFRVKLLPNPTAMVANQTGGRISAAEFKAFGGLIARLQNSEFEAKFVIKSYKIAAIGGSITQAQQYLNEGNRWSGNAAALVNRASPGTNIFFDEIRVVGPDGKEREISPIFFTLK
ncbi:MAG: GldM family protein, partial [Bacteroidota bacterium]